MDGQPVSVCQKSTSLTVGQTAWQTRLFPDDFSVLNICSLFVINLTDTPSVSKERMKDAEKKVTNSTIKKIQFFFHYYCLNFLIFEKKKRNISIKNPPKLAACHWTYRQVGWIGSLFRTEAPIFSPEIYTFTTCNIFNLSLKGQTTFSLTISLKFYNLQIVGLWKKRVWKNRPFILFIFF